MLVDAMGAASSVECLFGRFFLFEPVTRHAQWVPASLSAAPRWLDAPLVAQPRPENRAPTGQAVTQPRKRSVLAALLVLCREPLGLCPRIALRPMPTRTLYLVRHGQYIAADPGGGQTERLTPLGRQQAIRVGKRLREVTFDVMYNSTMPRAVETADVIATLLPPTRRTATATLREGLPSVAAHFEARFRPPAAIVKQTRDRMDSAFERFVRPSKKDRHELFVAHGNLIRYFMRKVLGDQETRWWQMDIIQCSLSVIRITPDRRILVSYNDVGHLPMRLRTHS